MNHTAIQWCAYSQPQSVTAVAHKRNYDSGKMSILQLILSKYHAENTKVYKRDYKNSIDTINPKP